MFKIISLHWLVLSDLINNEIPLREWVPVKIETYIIQLREELSNYRPA